jgi:NTE family protein
MAFPGVFTPVARNGLLLCDGCLTANLPVWAARKAGYKTVIGIDVDPFLPAQSQTLINGLAIVFRGIQILMSRSQKLKEDKATLTIIACKSNSNFDFTKKEALIRVGEEAVENQKAEIRKILLNPLKRILG